jgi:hypothetical protein
MNFVEAAHPPVGCGLTQEHYECGPAADKNALIIVYARRGETAWCDCIWDE